MIARAALLLSAILVSTSANAAAAAPAAAQATAVAQAVASSDRLAQEQSALAARGAELRREWIASGHSPAPGSAPSIVSGKILTPQLDVTKAPAAPAISVKFTTGPAGLSFISLTFAPSASSQYLSVTYATPYKAPPLTQGTLKIQRVGNAFDQGAFNLYSAAGAWTLTGLTIYDEAGNGTSYDQSQLAALFPSLTVNVVNNGTPDVTPPAVSSGKVLTPVVSLSSASPDFGASLKVSDDISGVQFGLITVTPPNSGRSLVANEGNASPVVNGTVKVYVYLGGTTITGTWTISQFGVCDVAGNCTYDTNPSDIQALFGTTTFKVKN